MFATHGFAELLTKEPLVHLVKDAEAFVSQVKSLAQSSYVDGVEIQRWKACHTETWDARASEMREELSKRLK
jgi:hypothetical protein